MSFKVDGVMHYATIIEPHIFDEANNCTICGYHKEVPVSPKQEVFTHINDIFLNAHHHH
jgi:hypothetical protein